MIGFARTLLVMAVNEAIAGAACTPEQTKTYTYGNDDFSSITVDGDGFIWVAQTNVTDRIHKIDPSTGNIILSSPVLSYNPRGLVTDNNGDVWVSWYGASKVIKLDLADGSFAWESSISNVWNIVISKAGSKNGWVWVTSDAGLDMYGFDPDALNGNGDPNITVSGGSPSSPRGLHADALGNIWSSTANNELLHYNTSTGVLTDLSLLGGVGAGADLDGIFYVPIESNPSGRFYRIDINTLADLGILSTGSINVYYRVYGDGFIDKDNNFWGSSGYKMYLITLDEIYVGVWASDLVFSVGAKTTVQTPDGTIYHVRASSWHEYGCPLTYSEYVTSSAPLGQWRLDDATNLYPNDYIFDPARTNYLFIVTNNYKTLESPTSNDIAAYSYNTIEAGETKFFELTMDNVVLDVLFGFNQRFETDGEEFDLRLKFTSTRVEIVVNGVYKGNGNYGILTTGEVLGFSLQYDGMVVRLYKNGVVTDTLDLLALGSLSQWTTPVMFCTYVKSVAMKFTATVTDPFAYSYVGTEWGYGGDMPKAIEVSSSYPGVYYQNTNRGVPGLIIDDSGLAASGDETAGWVGIGYIPELIIRTNDVSFSCIIKSVNNSAQTEMLMTYLVSRSESSDRILLWFDATGDLSWGIGEAGASLVPITYSGIKGDSLIHHIVATRESSVLYLYVDSILVASAANTVDINSNNGYSFNIGTEAYPGVPYPFEGTIDEVSIHDYALSASQISKMYGIAQLVSIYSEYVNSLGPVAYWRLGDTVPVSIDDDFTGTDGDAPNTTLWTSAAVGEASVTIDANRSKHVYTNANHGATLKSNYRFPGDFDVQADFDVSALTLAQTHQAGITLRWTEEDAGLYLIDIYVQTSVVGKRYESYVFEDGAQTVLHATSGFIPSDQVSLRVTRVGTLITVYTYDGGWVQLGITYNYSHIEPLQLQLAISSHTDNPAGVVYSDNVIVNSGTFVIHEAVDETGTYNGTYSGTPTLGSTSLLTGDSDTSVYFDGVDDRVNITPLLSTLGLTGSVCFICSIPVGGTDLVGAASATIGGNYIQLAANEEGPLFAYKSGNPAPGVDSFVIQSVENLTANVTYHLVFVQDDTVGVLMYINGVLATNNVVNGIPGARWFANNATFDTLNIGSLQAATNSFTEGTTDEVFITNDRLTQAEITNLYNKSIGN